MKSEALFREKMKDVTNALGAERSGRGSRWTTDAALVHLNGIALTPSADDTERGLVIKELGLEWDAEVEGWWVPAEPGPVLVSTLAARKRRRIVSELPLKSGAR